METTAAPLVSVVLPTYNRAQTLARAIRSVLNQGHQNLEVIVVDDGSRDNTAEVMATFDDPRVRYARLERNQGASAARNHGLSLARGDYIAFQDSDDEWLLDKLERQVAAAQEAGTPDVAVFHVKVVYGRDENRVYGPGRVCCVPRLSEAEHERDFVKITHRQNLMSPQTLMFSRSVLEKIGPFDHLLKNSVDWDFSLRLVRHAKVVFIDYPLVMTYIQDDSISILKRNMVRSQLRIILKLKRQGDVDPGVMADHFARIGLGLSRLGKTRSAGRLLRHSVQLAPMRAGNWARLFANLARGFSPRGAVKA